jgi:hypothetical protein
MLDLDAVLEKNNVSTEGINLGGNEEKSFEQPIQEQEAPKEEVIQEYREEPKQESPKQEPEKPVEREFQFPAERFGGKVKSWEDVEALMAKAERPDPFKDDYIKKIVDTYNAKGSLEDFFKAHSTNWEKMPAEEVLRRKIESQYDGLEKKHLDTIYKKELAKYNLDPEENTEEEIELGRALMERDANQFRQEQLKQQEGYFQPAPEPVNTDQIKKTVNSLPQVKSLLETKTLKYNIGDKEFNMEVKDPNFILESLVDERNFVNSFIKDGKPDVDAWIDVVAYAQNREGVRQALVDHGRSLGKEEVIDTDYKNSNLGKPKQSEDDSGENKWEALAKGFTEQLRR